MNNKMKHLLSLATFGLVLALFLPNPANAYDCGNDPIYARDWAGKTNIGSRVRDWACMQDSEILTVLPAGTQVHIIGETDGWYKVQAGNKTGWVGARLITVTSRNASDASKVTPDIKPTEQETKIIGIDEANFAKLQAGDSTLRSRLSGMVVLRVHHHGKAYKVGSDGSLTHLSASDVKAIKSEAKSVVKNKDNTEIEKEVKKESTQVKVTVRKIVGINEANFAKLEAGDLALRERLMNQIVLRVHHHGKAYWVKPAGGIKFLSKSEIGHYLTATPESSTKNTAKPSKKSQPQAPTQSGSITLEGQLTDPGKIKLTWSTQELDASKGFKVVMSETANPVYPGDKYHYHSSPTKRHDYWSKLANGKTYHFRVCQYLGGKCGVYSNDVAVTVATDGAFAEDVMPGTIDLTVTPLSGGKVDISWSISDMTSPKGFKVVMDQEPDPIYPGNDYHYLSDSESRSDTWTGLNSGSIYHFRVCEYLGGYCGTYSNDVQITAL